MHKMYKVQEENLIGARFAARRRYKSVLSKVYSNVSDSRHLSMDDQWILAQALLSNCLTLEEMMIIDHILQDVRCGRMTYSRR